MIKLDKVSAAITVSVVSVLISLGLVAKCRQISNKINDISAKIEKLESKIVPESQQSSPPTPVLSSGPPPSAPRVPSNLDLNFNNEQRIKNRVGARRKSNLRKGVVFRSSDGDQFIVDARELGKIILRDAGKGSINREVENKPSQDLIKKAANKLNHVPSNLRFQSYWKNLSKRDRLSAPWLREIHEGAKNVRSGSGPKENKDERAQELNSENNGEKVEDAQNNEDNDFYSYESYRYYNDFDPYNHEVSSNADQLSANNNVSSENNGEKINVAVSDGTNNVYDTLSDAAKKSIQEKVNKMNEPFR